jgi:hypothetical protein
LGARTVVVSFPRRTMQGRSAPFWQRQIAQMAALAGRHGWGFDRVPLPTEELVVVRKDSGRGAPG